MGDALESITQGLSEVISNPSCHLSGDEDRIRNMIFQAAN